MNVATVLAGRDVAAERRGAATLDGRHHLELAEAEVAGVGLAPGRAMGAEDIRDLEPFPGHETRRYEAFFCLPLPLASSSSGLLTALSVRLSTRL